MALISRLSPITRWLLVAPMVAFAPLAVLPAPSLLGATGVQAAQLGQSGGMTLQSSGRSGRQVPAGSATLLGSGGPLPDTCTSTDPWGLCDLDDFIARCDAAGGGLSTQPGGGVDCDTSHWD